MTFLLLGLAIASEIVGTMSLRQAEGFHRPVWVVVAVASYAVSLFLLAQVLHLGMPIGVVYTVWSGMGIVTIAAIGWLVLEEPLSGVQFLGIAFVLVGVVALQLGACSGNSHSESLSICTSSET